MENSSKTNKKFTAILLVGLFLIGVSVILALKSFKQNDIQKIEVNSSSKIDYSVALNPNSFYEKDVLPSNMEYIASLIKYINTDIDYTIKSTDVLNYDYSYYIEAIIKVYGDTSKANILFEKSDILKEEQKLNSANSKNINIKENIKIDYNEYNKLISKFKTSYLLNSYSDVQIVMHVNATAKSDKAKESIVISEETGLILPLTQQTINIKVTEQPASTYNVISGQNQKGISDMKLFVCSLVILGSGIVLVISSLIKLLQRDQRAYKVYEKTLSKILREYDLIIANVEDDVDETNYEVIHVSSFTELKDVHDNIGNPILFREKVKNKLSIFTIIKDNILYKYELKDENYEKNKKNYKKNK